MTGTAAEVAATEPVEPQSLKKLSFKSLKRSLNLFSPVHGHHPPPDPESNRIRVSYKLNAEYGSVKNLSIERAREQGRDNAQGQGHQASTSSELALTGNHESRDPQREGGQNALVAVPSMLPRWPDTGNQSRNVAGAVVSFPGSSEGHHSTSALMERIPSRWPRPTWHAPWKNYRVISGHLGWVRSVAFDPSNSWFCTGSADRTIKVRIARIFNTYGPRMCIDDGRVVSNFVAQALRKEPLTVYGDGKQTRSFQYVSDLVEGLMRLMEGGHVGPFNLGNPGEFTMLELARVVQDAIDPNARIEFRQNTEDDPHKRKPDITRAKELLGWEPRVSLREGLPLMVSDFRKRIFGDHSSTDTATSA